MGCVKFGLRFWWIYCMNTTLLLITHILCTQKWAAGFTEPAVTDSTNVCGEYRCINSNYTKKEPAMPVLMYSQFARIF